MAKAHKDMILKIEAIPRETHGVNVRSKMSPDDWDILRRHTYQQANYVCEICGGKGKRWPVEAHEVWHYDIEKQLQILVQIQALCTDCHMCKHIGRAIKMGKKQQVFKHFRKVNKIRNVTMERVFEEVIETYEQLNQIKFKVDITFAKNLLRDIKKEQQSVKNMTFKFKKGGKRL